MDVIGDRYNTRLCQYADRQEMFNIREWVPVDLDAEETDSRERIVIDWRRNTPWITLPRVCLALKRIHWKMNTWPWWNIWRSSFRWVCRIWWSSSFVSALTRSLDRSLDFSPVVSPRLAAYLNTKGYSILPKDATDYVTELIQQILTRRRQHLERRNDFIQIMVDHEEAVQDEEPSAGGSKRSKTHCLRFHFTSRSELSFQRWMIEKSSVKLWYSSLLATRQRIFSSRSFSTSWPLNPLSKRKSSKRFNKKSAMYVTVSLKIDDQFDRCLE